MPEITVFMTAFNASRHISNAIKSILNQTFTDFELLIIDDGSKDETYNIAASFTDSRIRILKNEQNKGLLFSRNIALKEAKGKYLAILDSDDIALENRLEIQYKEFQKRPKLALLGTPTVVIDDAGKETGEYVDVKCGKEQIPTELFFANTFIHSSILMKTEVFRVVGGYQVHLAEDYDLWVRIAMNHEVDNLNFPLVKYRKHDNNISKTQGDKLIAELYPIKQKQLDKINIPISKEIFEIITNHPRCSGCSIEEYYQVILNILEQNSRYPYLESNYLKKRLFHIWYEAIIHKSRHKALPLLFQKDIFSWEYVTFKQIRKTFKLSLKSIFGISKNKT